MSGETGPAGSVPAEAAVVVVPRVSRPPAAVSTALTEAELVAADADCQLSEGAAALVARGLAGNTRSAYQRHWAPFERWCHLRGRTSLPATAETLAEYLHHLTGTTTQYGGPPSASTLNHVLGCLQAAHKHAGQVCDVRLARLALRAYRRDAAHATAAVTDSADADGAEGNKTPAKRGRSQSRPIALAELRTLVH